MSEGEIQELEQCYYQLFSWNNNNNRQQQMTLEIFTSIISPVLPPILIPAVFQAFDDNRDGKFSSKLVRHMYIVIV